MPRKTDSHNPGDWLWIASSDLELIRIGAEREVSHAMCRSKLAEVLEKILKAELLRLGWKLVKTHDLRELHGFLTDWNSSLAGPAQPLCESLQEVYFTDRYPGYDFEEPDWPAFRAEVAEVTALHAAVQSRLPTP